MYNTTLTQSKLQFSKDVTQYYPEVLSDEAMEFLIALHEKFNSKRLDLLEKRKLQQAYFGKGGFPPGAITGWP